MHVITWYTYIEQAFAWYTFRVHAFISFVCAGELVPVEQRVGEAVGNYVVHLPSAGICMVHFPSACNYVVHLPSAGICMVHFPSACNYAVHLHSAGNIIVHLPIVPVI